jgi:hypothetical protein
LVNNVDKKIFYKTLIFTVLITTVAIGIYASAQAQNERPTLIYGYKLSAHLPGNLSITEIYSVSPTTVMGIATSAGNYYIVVLELENPYEEPRLTQLYPVLGEITAIATNGWPVKRIAVGTSMGELLIFNIEGGRIYQLVDRVLGADFYVKKILVLRNSTSDNFVYAVMVDEAGGGNLCAQCSIYVVSETQPGYIRIGSPMSDTSLYVPNKLISDMTARVVYAENSYYYDASYLVVSSIDKPNLIRIDVNVTYYDYQGNQTKPASGALIDVYAYNQAKSYRYSVNADQSGIATIFVERGMIAEITAWDIIYRNYTIVINTSNLPSYQSFTSQTITLYYPPLAVPAETKTPPYLLCSLDVYDVTQAPNKLISRGKIANTTNPAFPFDLSVSFFNKGLSLIYLKQTGEHALTYYDVDTQSLILWRVKEKDGKLQAYYYNKDYVGKQTFLVNTFTTPTGSYLYAVLSDARIRIYRIPTSIDEGYRILDIYRAGSTLISSKLVLATNKYILATETPEGTQILELSEELVIPVLRKDLTLNYRLTDQIDSDISDDLSSFFILASNNQITVYRNLNLHIGDQLFDPNQYMTGSLTLFIKVNPEDMDSLTVYFRHPWGETKIKPSINGTVIIPNIIPNVTYTIYIESSKPYIIPLSITLSFSDYQDHVVVLKPEYKSYTLKLRLADDKSMVLIAPIDILIDDELLVSNNTKNEIELRVYYGNHTLTIKPSTGYENVYEILEAPLYITQDTEQSYTLLRRTYMLRATMIDSEEQKLLGPVKVRITDEAGSYIETIITPLNPSLLVSLPYGQYTINISPTDETQGIYEEISTTIKHDRDQSTTLIIPRRTYLLNIIIRDITFGALRGSFVVYVNDKPVSGPFSINTTLTLPYGKYIIRAQPTEQYAKVYNPSQNISLMLTRDTELVVNMTRKTYKIGILVMEKNRPVQGAEIRFMSIDGRRLVTILMTNQDGYVETSLPYGDYTIEASLKGFNPTTITYTLESSSSLTIQIKPTVTTLVIRVIKFTLPYIGVAVAIVASIYGLMRLREVIRRRMAREEAPF